MLPPAAGSGDLNTFQPAACCFRSGFSLLASASFSLPITISKSAVLSALMKFRIMPPSPGNVRVVGACAAGTAGGAGSDDGDDEHESNTSKPSSGGLNLAGSKHRGLLRERAVTVTYSGSHEN